MLMLRPGIDYGGHIAGTESNGLSVLIWSFVSLNVRVKPPRANRLRRDRNRPCIDADLPAPFEPSRCTVRWCLVIPVLQVSFLVSTSGHVPNIMLACSNQPTTHLALANSDTSWVLYL